ncbi:uncharacterized protein LOC108030603 [Drosophila biarmipes]|uniref:uncharacterized protein LOC108030603 n=1 Tax=Drosophila biarmipes TaxID=125945 RepID=UPI0007E72517|nr:uncharacterized protein LOC108030603 [Drosophila biarmipes]
MENKNRKGRSFVLEREERVSIEGRQRIYIQNTQKKVRELFRHPSVGVSRYATKKAEAERSSSSLGVEKIQRTREQVDRLYRKIQHEIDKLKDFRSHFLKDTDAGSRSGSPERAKNMTWGQSLEANQLKVSPRAAERSPSSSPRAKGRSLKCRTIGVKNSPAIDSPELQRVSGGCSYCCGNCDQNHQTIYQNCYGSGTCHCHCSCKYKMGYPQQFTACNTLNGEILPHQGMHFGIPYNICPRPTFGRVATDLNTKEHCKNLRTKLTTDRASSPKARKDCSMRTKSQERKPLARSGKCATNKKAEGPIKAETTLAPKVQDKTKSSEKLSKATLKKEQESLEDGNRGMPKVKSENVTVSKVVTSKAIINDGDPSKLCSEEQTDETKVRMYHDYLNLYKQENSRSELEGQAALQPIPTYTRMPVEEGKRETDQKPTMKQPADSPPLSDSDRIKDQAMEKGNSEEDQGVQESREDPCCCDAGQNTLEGQSSTDERIISTQDYCCCDVFEGGNTGDHKHDRIETTNNYQSTDVGSPSSSPESGPVYSHEERRHALSRSHGRCNQDGYSPSANLKKQSDNSYFNVTSWNYTNTPRSHDDRNQNLTGSAPKVSRMHSQQSSSYRCKDKDSVVIKQEKREFSKERFLMQTVPKEKRKLRSQQSPSPRSVGNTSYAPFAPQHQKALPEMQFQREARKNQAEIPCHEERPMQTVMQPKIEKASKMRVDQENYRTQEDRTLPNQSRTKNTDSNLTVSSQSESAETIVKNRNQHVRYNYSDNETNGYSLHDRFVDSNRDMQQHTPWRFEAQEKSPRYRSDYGHVYDQSNYEALDCMQDDLREPSYTLDCRSDDMREPSYRIPRETQKSRNNSPHASHKQTIPRQHSPRNPKDFYEQVSQRPPKKYNSQISPAEGFTRNQSRNMNYSANDQSSSSHSHLDHSQSDHYQCSGCPETYKTLEQVQKMRRNVDHHQTRTNDSMAKEHYSKCSSFPDFECDRYDEKQMKNPLQVFNESSPRSCLSSPRHPSPAKVLETVCEKRTRTVTFEDDGGDLTKEEHVKETCRSLIDWERALKYHMVDQSGETNNSDDNYTCRSSSSGEHTCLESTYDDDFASCEEGDPQSNPKRVPRFYGCPCMYQTYKNLANMCQKDGRFIQ